MSNILTRTLTGALFIVVLVGAISISEYSSAALFLVLALLGQNEFYKISKKKKISTQKLLGLALSALTFILSVGAITELLPLKYIYLIIPVFFSIFVVELFRKKSKPFTDIAYSLLGIMYVTLPFVLMFHMGYFSQYQFSSTYNPNLLLSILILSWSNDTGAYLVGRSFGKTKLFKRISPKKTWEGSVGGAILTVVSAYFVNLYLLDLALLDCFVITFIVIFFGTLGDLVESMLKRSADIKDSSDLLPGHGGILDRFDGLLIAAPFLYTYLKLICYV